MQNSKITLGAMSPHLHFSALRGLDEDKNWLQQTLRLANHFKMSRYSLFHKHLGLILYNLILIGKIGKPIEEYNKY